MKHLVLEVMIFIFFITAMYNLLSSLVLNGFKQLIKSWNKPILKVKENIKKENDLLLSIEEVKKTKEPDFDNFKIKFLEWQTYLEKKQLLKNEISLKFQENYQKKLILQFNNFCNINEMSEIYSLASFESIKYCKNLPEDKVQLFFFKSLNHFSSFNKNKEK